MQHLTSKQATILNWIVAHVKAHHRPPSLREIAEEVGIKTPGGVARHLDALAAKGYLARDGGYHGIRVLLTSERKRLAVIEIEEDAAPT